MREKIKAEMISEHESSPEKKGKKSGVLTKENEDKRTIRMRVQSRKNEEK
jgi:hypothetical protein